MHGLLIDKKNGFSQILPGLKSIDCGNFISFAVRERIINKIVWIHDEYGGRANDLTHVKYITDITAIPYLIRNNFVQFPKYALEYNVQNFNGLTSLEISEGVHLDIDWDFFALKSKPEKDREKSVASFLALDFKRIPNHTYISYSNEYVSSSKKEFNDFILQLKHKFKANLIKYAYPLPKKESPTNFLVKYKNGLGWRFRGYLYFPFKKVVNKMGIY